MLFPATASFIIRIYHQTGLLIPPHVPQAPLCDLAIMSIECDDISKITPTPRSVLDAEGKSGQSLGSLHKTLRKCFALTVFTRFQTVVLKASRPVLYAEMQSLRYLGACALEDRPAGIVWECVANLNSYRGKDISEKGTDVVKAECEQLGYVTQFQCLDSFLKASSIRILTTRL